MLHYNEAMRHPLGKVFSEFLVRLLNDEDGQALVEFMLMMAVSISVVSIIGTAFRKSLLNIWKQLTGEITAACACCPHSPQFGRSSQCPS